MKSEFDYFTHLNFGKAICELERAYPTAVWSCFTNVEIMDLMSVEDIKRLKDFISEKFSLYYYVEKWALELTTFAREFHECILKGESFTLDSIKY